MMQRYSVPAGGPMTFDFERTATQVSYRFQSCKKFDKFTARYSDGHVIVGRRFPDGHFEYDVR